jgi:hypothetical protein
VRLKTSLFVVCVEALQAIVKIHPSNSEAGQERNVCVMVFPRICVVVLAAKARTELKSQNAMKRFF